MRASLVLVRLSSTSWDGAKNPEFSPDPAFMSSPVLQVSPFRKLSKVNCPRLSICVSFFEHLITFFLVFSIFLFARCTFQLFFFDVICFIPNFLRMLFMSPLGGRLLVVRAFIINLITLLGIFLLPGCRLSAARPTACV